MLAGGAADYTDFPLRDAVRGVMALGSIHCTTVSIAVTCGNDVFVEEAVAV